MNVLFLWTGNSCRSVLSEATFNHFNDKAALKAELDKIGTILA